jgi:hypothetical protein
MSGIGSRVSFIMSGYKSAYDHKGQQFCCGDICCRLECLLFVTFLVFSNL